MSFASKQDLDVFERGERANRRGFFFLAGFMALLGGSGALYALVEGTQNRQVGKLLVAGVACIVVGLALAISQMRRNPGLDVLAKYPSAIVWFYSVHDGGAVKIRICLETGATYDLPLDLPVDEAAALHAV